MSRRSWAKTTLLGAVCAAAIGLAAPTLAQSGSDQAPIRYVQIEAQPLSSAILVFSQEYGIAVSGDGALIQGKTTSPVSGRYAPAAALSTMLRGTGLTATSGRTGGYVLVQKVSRTHSAAPEQAAVAEEIIVTGNVRGQVATEQQLGLLGTKGRLETPLSTTSFTAEYIKNRQATEIYQVLQGIPSVQATTTPNQGVTNFQSRGVQVSRDGFGFNGTGESGIRRAAKSGRH